MNSLERIEAIKQHFHLTYSSLAREIGLKNPQPFYDIRAGKCGISKDIATKIQERFSNVSLAWMITGEGRMLTDGSDEVVETPNMIPLIPYKALGGMFDDFNEVVMASDCERISSPIRGVDYAIQVSGDSMEPDYPSGSTVLIKRIDEKLFLEWGRAYVLNTSNGTVIKTLTPSDREGFVRCVSLNPDPVYAPFEVPWSSVQAVYRILMCMMAR